MRYVRDEFWPGNNGNNGAADGGQSRALMALFGGSVGNFVGPKVGYQ